jgi:hypothetical protein
MSFSIEVENLISTLWDTLRPAERSTYRLERHPDGGVTEKGLVITLDLRMSHISGGCDEYHRTELFSFVLTGNTAVFMASSDDFTPWDRIPVGMFHNFSNHDSCWRTDGMSGLQQSYHFMCDSMNKEIVEHGFSPLAPREFHQFCTLGSLGRKPWEFVSVTHRKIPTEDHRREILAIERE